MEKGTVHRERTARRQTSKMREMTSYSVPREQLGAAGASSEGAQGEGKKLQKSPERIERDPSGTESWVRDGFPAEEGGSWAAVGQKRDR